MVTPVGRCLCHESVSARNCCCLCSRSSMSTTDGKDGDGDGSDDEMKKLVREKMKTTTLLHQEHGRVPSGGAHLRNGQVPSRGAQQRGSWVSKGVARSKNGRVSKGVGHLRNGRVLVGTAPLRKKNHLATVNGEATTSGDRGGSDSPVTDLVTNLAAHVEIVDDVVIKEIVDSGGDGKDVDEIVQRATVDLGVDGNPIILGVLSPAEYRNLVFNMFLYLPLVDADYQ